jgi:putative transposase
MPKRIDPKVEAIVQGAINGYYLTCLRPSLQQTIDEIIGRCRSVCLKPPHPNTIRGRIKAVDKKKMLDRREGARTTEALTVEPNRSHWTHNEAL